ncbi:MAG: succinate--CoA ligase [ADP-forming] subunit beta [Pirellulaceae bacterium]|nr:MAG: succinate--CoA ligase [ADP-forming] subunit beta [Pirellulaceae bacterium]
MKIHEYQAKELFRQAGIRVPRGIVASTPVEASEAFRQLGQPLAVVKAQIHAGGRGKGTVAHNPAQRGVQLVRNPEEAFQVASALLGHPLVTVQTGPEGKTVQRVLVEEGCRIDRELYLGIVVDRAAALPVFMASTEGGVEIEKVAAESPEKIFKEHFDPSRGLQPFQVRKLCRKLGLAGTSAKAAHSFFTNLCRFFVQHDCSLVEINPLVVDGDGQLLALDAKVNFDDNAAFRHPEWQQLRDLSEEEPAEVRASQAGLSYVKLNGNIGCLVNGAGLAMATMDIIKYYGGEPANFLDVGGGANTQQVTEAFRILLADANVRAVLVNIFGGIMKCTTIAEALLEAYRTVGFNVPLVVRLEGTEVEQGRRILGEAGVNIITASDLADAAQKVVQAAGLGR